METFGQLIESLNRVLWGLPMIVFLFGTHLYLTFKTRFIQKKILTGIKLSFAKDTDAAGDISQFASLATALASTMGTGNIIGIGTAIALGGPGAVFWCWITGIFGIATKYAESLIAVKYRVKTEDGTMLGGAMYALERGLNQKFLGVLFALFAALAAFGIGCGVQANAISSMLHGSFGINPMLVGIVLACVTFAVIFGGVKSIAKVCEGLVPFMSLLYLAGCAYILVCNRAYILPSVVLICKAAFTTRAATGGFIGSTLMLSMRFGIARGLFTNESGMGSAPIVSAAAQTRNSVRAALVASTGAFWDTVVVCLMTGLVLVSSVLAQKGADFAGDDGSRLTADAFSRIPYVGTPILVFGIVSFAFATILGWCYYGERCAEYLFGKKAIKPYRGLWVLVLLFAPVIHLTLLWNLSDTLNALMAIPNLLAVIALSPVIRSETDRYINNLEQRDTTEIPIIPSRKRKDTKTHGNSKTERHH